VHAGISLVCMSGKTGDYSRWVIKKSVQQGHNERKGKEVQTALRVGRSPLQCVLANGKAPLVFPTSSNLLLRVEPLTEARTPLADIFSILLSLTGESDHA
jgi:hypothetical protein